MEHGSQPTESSTHLDEVSMADDAAGIDSTEESSVPEQSLEGGDPSHEHGEAQSEEATPSAEEDRQDTPDQSEETLGDEDRQKGYLRHEDYTQKTQEIAEERRRLEEERARVQSQEQLLNEIREQQRLGLMSEEERAQYEAEKQLDQIVQDRMQPVLDQKMKELEQKFQPLQEHLQVEAVKQEERALRDKYSLSEAEAVDVGRFALKHNLPSLEAAYKVKNFDQHVALERKKGAQQAEKTIQKRNASVATQPGVQGNPDMGSEPNYADMSYDEIHQDILNNPI